ncbi:hypothetical protein [Anaerotalea alkaliphila]|nr:hypothetical protein [Anaerotalea alkaliphila]
MKIISLKDKQQALVLADRGRALRMAQFWQVIAIGTIMALALMVR